MKSLVVGIALVCAVAVAAADGNGPANKTAEQQSQVTKLLADMKCDNCTVRTNAAYELGEIGASEAVIPLMAILHNDPDESARIVAALALSRLGDARGEFAVRQAARFDESQRVRTLSAWYYEQYVQSGSFKFVTNASPTETIATK